MKILPDFLVSVSDLVRVYQIEWGKSNPFRNFFDLPLLAQDGVLNLGWSAILTEYPSGDIYHDRSVNLGCDSD